MCASQSTLNRYTYIHTNWHAHWTHHNIQVGDDALNFMLPVKSEFISSNKLESDGEYDEIFDVHTPTGIKRKHDQM